MRRRVPASIRAAALASLLLGGGIGMARAASPTSLQLADLVDPTAVVDLGGIWLFQRGDDPAFAHPILDDSDWEQRLVPTVRTSWRERWRGHGWYRLHLGVGAQALGADWMVSLGRAREAVEVYWNGALVAQRGRFGARAEGGERSTPLVAFVPAALVRPGDNVIAVRVHDPTYGGGLVAGPLLLGPPSSVADLTRRERVVWPSVHLGLAALALVVGVGHLVFARGRWARREAWWIALAGVGLAVAHLGETGLLAGLVPVLELGPRLPLTGAVAAALGLAGFFAVRHDDMDAPRVVWGRAGFLVAIAALLLVPDAVAFWAAVPAVFVAALAGTLYGAWLLARAARRQEVGALPVFAALVGFALLLVLDGIVASAAVAPSTSLVAAVGLFLISSFSGAGATLAPHERALAAGGALAHGDPIGILDATALSSDRERFLETLVHEVVRGMAVRRCSLALAHGDQLVVAAAVGLPRHLRATPVPLAGSIAGWVFTHRQPLSDRNLPEELAHVPSSGQYATRAFLSHPVLDGDRCIGVLNVSDPLDAGAFDARGDEAMASIAHKVAAALARLGDARAA
jgi:hypothetical protein